MTATSQSADYFPPGVISVNEVYRADEFQSRMGWGNDALYDAYLCGLRMVLDAHGLSFVRGVDAINYLTQLMEEEERERIKSNHEMDLILREQERAEEGGSHD